MDKLQGNTPNTRDLQPKILSMAMNISACPQNQSRTKPPGFKRTYKKTAVERGVAT